MKYLKNSQGKTSPWLAMGMVLVILALAFIGYSVSQTQFGNDDATTGGDCNTAPFVSVKAVDALNTGSTVSEDSIEARLDNTYIGTITSDDSFAKGQKIDILVKKSNYLDKVLADDKVLSCGSNTLTTSLYANTGGSMKFINENNNVLTDSASADSSTDTTQSASDTKISIGGEIQANADESTGNMVVVVEGANSTQIDSITSGDASEVETPEFYSNVASNSEVQAFSYSALEDGANGEFDLVFNPESDQSINGTAVYVTAYSAQDGVAEDGSFLTDVVEDSEGNTLYESTFDYDFCIGNCSA